MGREFLLLRLVDGQLHSLDKANPLHLVDESVSLVSLPFLFDEALQIFEVLQKYVNGDDILFLS